MRGVTMTVKEKEMLGISKYAPVKAVVKLDDDGNVIEQYESVKEAAEKNGIKAQTICNAIKRKGKAGGMKFDYTVHRQKPVFLMPKPKKVANFQSGHLPYGGVYS